MDSAHVILVIQQPFFLLLELTWRQHPFLMLV